MKYYKEILIIEAIIFIAIWIANEYLATLLTFIFIPLFTAILAVSLIAEKIERSKISKNYFYLMAGLALIPLLIFLFISVVNGGSSFDWAKQ
ncbi:MAG: hypothetical protein IPL08_16990 [Saprospiraceae bacterium]|nr:hypothetical protein [Saprospiraceae bacterium]MBK8670550.1 hypothetical protein [Saprospiraceae bacterium]MBL0102153.1 hypothetical protein [Saprospiraceae bacterium]